jgi:hypothetical protein
MAESRCSRRRTCGGLSVIRRILGYVNVGNYESLGPLGCKIENPFWSDKHDYFPQRAVIAYVRPPAREALVKNGCAMLLPDLSDEDHDGFFPSKEEMFSNNPMLLDRVRTSMMPRTRVARERGCRERG